MYGCLCKQRWQPLPNTLSHTYAHACTHTPPMHTLMLDCHVCTPCAFRWTSSCRCCPRRSWRKGRTWPTTTWARWSKACNKLTTIRLSPLPLPPPPHPHPHPQMPPFYPTNTRELSATVVGSIMDILALRGCFAGLVDWGSNIHLLSWWMKGSWSWLWWIADAGCW